METAKVYVGKLLIPANAVVNKVKRVALNNNATRPKDILAAQAAHKAEGTDMAMLSSKRFFYEQFNLVGYRVERMFLEMDAVRNGAWFNKSYNYKCFVVDIRTATQMLFAYMLMFMIERGSIFPLIYPGSPLEMGARMRTNPN
jgi:hypothetical protein